MINTLSKDPIMKNLIDEFGILSLDSNYMKSSGNLLYDLSSYIIRQQLSNKVADKIWQKFVQLFENDITCNKILATTDIDFKEIGISTNKIKYLKSLAQNVQDKTVELDKLESLSDEEAVMQLTKIKGIGQWTAEMFLMFSLHRADVFAFGDLGLNKALQNLYGNGELLSIEQQLEITSKWSPFKSYASLYLWKSLEQ